jgi:hypothetical protein
MFGWPALHLRFRFAMQDMPGRQWIYSPISRVLQKRHCSIAGEIS